VLVIGEEDVVAMVLLTATTSWGSDPSLGGWLEVSELRFTCLLLMSATGVHYPLKIGVSPIKMRRVDLVP
jgi:hypothetical protein